MAMAATFPSQIESARFNEDNDTVVLINPYLSKEPDNLLMLSKSQLRDRLERLQNRLQRAEETIHLMHDQLQTLSMRGQISDSREKQKRIPEPAKQSSTYIVPKRQRSQRFDRATRSVPFYLLMVFLGVGLATTIALTIPMTSAQIGFTPLLMVVLKGLFVVVAVSTVGSFALEVSRHHAH
jgi:hypothetical protein